MKSKIVLLALAIVAIPALVFGAWNVNVTWTESIGPDLAVTKVLLDDVEQCSVNPGDQAVCNFQVADVTGQILTVRSLNSVGTFADIDVVLGTIAPSTGVTVTTTYVP